MNASPRFIATLFLISSSTAWCQLPTGPSGIIGDVLVESISPSSLKITQKNPTAVINWDSFSIGENSQVEFLAQGLADNTNFAILNRVSGAFPQPSIIDGSIISAGTVFLLNDSGILIGPKGSIDVGGSFVATSLDLSDDDFEKYHNGREPNPSGGDLNFGIAPGQEGKQRGEIKVHGKINAGGDVFLIAPIVKVLESSGSPADIKAGRRVGIGAGTEVLVRPTGDERLFVRARDTTKFTNGANTDIPIEIGAGAEVNSAIAELKAHGGNGFGMAIKNSGRISATSADLSGGRVYLRSSKNPPSANKAAINLDKGSTVEASRDSSGGIVEITSPEVIIADTKDGIVIRDSLGDPVGGGTIDVSGKSSGGEIRIGGGQNGTFLANADPLGPPNLENADSLILGDSSKLIADATANGPGGSITLWSEKSLEFGVRSTISTSGKGFRSHGGDIHIGTGGLLDFFGTNDRSGANGASAGLLSITAAGLFLHDSSLPTPPEFNPLIHSIINADTLDSELDRGNLRLSTLVRGLRSPLTGVDGLIFINQDFVHRTGFDLGDPAKSFNTFNIQSAGDIAFGFRAKDFNVPSGVRFSALGDIQLHNNAGGGAPLRPLRLSTFDTGLFEIIANGDIFIGAPPARTNFGIERRVGLPAPPAGTLAVESGFLEIRGDSVAFSNISFIVTNLSPNDFATNFRDISESGDDGIIATPARIPAALLPILIDPDGNPLFQESISALTDSGSTIDPNSSIDTSEGFGGSSDFFADLDLNLDTFTLGATGVSSGIPGLTPDSIRDSLGSGSFSNLLDAIGQGDDSLQTLLHNSFTFWPGDGAAEFDEDSSRLILRQIISEDFLDLLDEETRRDLEEALGL